MTNFRDSQNVVQPKRVVILVHGIRTYGHWMDEVARLLEDEGYEVVSYRYGYFNLASFLMPLWRRRKAVANFIDEYKRVKSFYDSTDISVIAHSFGTYVVGKSLNNEDVILNKVIFCGAVISRYFSIDDFHGRVSLPIINDCSARDVFPALAASSSWGYSSSGTHGLGMTGVKDRFHEFGHSGYFNQKFVKKYWLPFLRSGDIVRSPLTKGSPSLAVITSIPIRWLWLLIPAATAAYLWINPRLPCDTVWVLAGVYSADGNSTSKFVELVEDASRVPSNRDDDIVGRDVVRTLTSRNAIIIGFQNPKPRLLLDFVIKDECDGEFERPSAARYTLEQEDYTGIRFRRNTRLKVIEVDDTRKVENDPTYPIWLRVRYPLAGE